MRIPTQQTEVQLGRFRIDVVRGDELIEIQHGPLAAIRGKVKSLLAHHRVRVVKPIVLRKQLVKRAARGRRVVDRRMSPKRGSLLELFHDLVYFSRVFPHPNLTAGSATGGGRRMAVSWTRPPSLATTTRPPNRGSETAGCRRRTLLPHGPGSGDASCRPTCPAPSTHNIWPRRCRSRPGSPVRLPTACAKRARLHHVGKLHNWLLYQRTAPAEEPTG